MKNLLLLTSLFITGLAFSQCFVFSSGPVDITTQSGVTITSAPVIVNNLNVSYQWYKMVYTPSYQLIPITNGTHYSGVTTNQITIYNVNYSDGGLSCRVTNLANGCQEDTNFYIRVCDDITLQPINVTANLNSSATFIVNHPNPSATYQWRTDLGAGYNNVTNAGQYSGANTNTLTVSNVSMSNNNQYFYCRVNSNSYCPYNSDSVVLLINSTSSISENYNSKYSVSPNPVTNSFSINGIESLDNITSILLKDMHGKIVKELVPDNMTFEIQDLKSGVYLVEIFTNDTTETIRIVKQ